MQLKGGMIDHVTRLDQLRASENIRWIVTITKFSNSDWSMVISSLDLSILIKSVAKMI